MYIRYALLLLPVFTTTLVWMAPAQASVATEYIPVTMRIENAAGTIYDDQVYVPGDGCTVTDSDGAQHDFSSATALCALDTAAAYGGFSYVLQDSSYGLYLDAISDSATAGADYWSFYVNYAYASVGLADYEIASGDTIVLSFGSYGNLPLKMRVRKKQIIPGQTIVARVKTLNETTGLLEPIAGATVMFGDIAITTDADGYASYTPTALSDDLTVYAQYGTFTKSNVASVRTGDKHTKRQLTSVKRRQKKADRAIAYLLDQIDETGLVAGSQSLTDWTAMLLGKAGKQNAKIRAAVSGYDPTVADGTNELARNILAREALALPTTKYVQRLKNTESNNQFGSEAFINEEVFTILALHAAGVPLTHPAYTTALREIQAGVNTDGGISYAKEANISDVDTTAFLLQALSVVRSESDKTSVNTKSLRRDALRYVQEQQNIDGGWGYSEHQTSNSSSTAVSLQAVKSLGLQPGDVMRNNRNGHNFLNLVQRKTGAYQYDVAGSQSSEEYNTAYAAMSLLGITLAE